MDGSFDQNQEVAYVSPAQETVSIAPFLPAKLLPGPIFQKRSAYLKAMVKSTQPRDEENDPNPVVSSIL